MIVCDGFSLPRVLCEPGRLGKMMNNWHSVKLIFINVPSINVWCLLYQYTAHYTATRQSGNNLYLPHSSTQDQPRLGKTEKHHLFCKKREEGGGLELTNRQLTSELSLTHADRRLKWEERLKNGMFSDLNCCGIMVCSGNGGPWTSSWVGAIRAETSEQTLTDHRVMMIHPDNCQSQAGPASASPEHKHNNKAGRGETRTALLLTDALHGIFLSHVGCDAWYLIDWGLVLRWRAEAGDRGQGWHWQLQISFHHFVIGVISNITTSSYVTANRENRLLREHPSLSLDSSMCIFQ